VTGGKSVSVGVGVAEDVGVGDEVSVPVGVSVGVRDAATVSVAVGVGRIETSVCLGIRANKAAAPQGISKISRIANSSYRGRIVTMTSTAAINPSTERAINRTGILPPCQ
jgi:hypothetical protein